MIAAIGMFDGVHRGHAELLKEAKMSSARDGDVWGIITFTRSDDACVLEHKSALPIFSAREMGIIEELFAIPKVVRLSFTNELKNMSPSEFIDMISRDHSVRSVVVGEEFRFGRDRIGTPDVLRRLCDERGMECSVIPLARSADGRVISSTAVRVAVSEGRVDAARDLLGYPYFRTGSVVHGDERGRLLGCPTANLEISEKESPIAVGVYAAVAAVHGCLYLGACNVGNNPTFGDVEEVRIEVNLSDFDEDIYGDEISVLFIEQIRPQIRFGSADELRAQLARDRAIASKIADTYISENGIFLYNFLKAIAR